MPALNLDRSIFSVFRQYSTGIEANVDPAMTRAEVIDNIVRGENGFERDYIVAIVEANPIEGWSRDVTAEILAEADALCEPEPRRRATQEQIWDRARDYRKHEAA